jgi:hypothetical protein
MSTSNPVLTISLSAGADLSESQYRAVRKASDALQVPGTAGRLCLGVLQNAPVSGEAGAVCVLGVSKVEIGNGTNGVVENDWVQCDTAGCVMPLGSSGEVAMGIMLDAGVAGDLGRVLLTGPSK